MRLKPTLATLLVVILLSGSCAASSCGASCALKELQLQRDHQVGTSSASPAAEVTICSQDHHSNDGVLRNSTAVWVSDAAGCDDDDCDAVPAVVQSSDILKNDGSSNGAASVVFQAADGRPVLDRISRQVPLLLSTSPPSRKTILRV